MKVKPHLYMRFGYWFCCGVVLGVGTDAMAAYKNWKIKAKHFNVN